MPRACQAEQLTKAERLRDQDADGDEELMYDAGGAAQTGGRDLGQVGGNEAARHAALHAVQKAADDDALGRAQVRRQEDNDRAGNDEHVVEDDALLAAHLLGHGLGRKGANHAADDEQRGRECPQECVELLHARLGRVQLNLDRLERFLLFRQRVSLLLDKRFER